jgi:hypothetical protein
MGVQSHIVVEATVQPVTMTRYAACPRLRGFWFRGPAQANPHVTPQLWQVLALTLSGAKRWGYEGEER